MNQSSVTTTTTAGFPASDRLDQLEDRLAAALKRIEELERRPVFVPIPAIPGNPYAPAWPWTTPPGTPAQPYPYFGDPPF